MSHAPMVVPLHLERMIVAKRCVRLWFTDFPRLQSRAGGIPYGLEFLGDGFDLVLDPHRPEFLVYSVAGYRFYRYRCPRILWLGENMAPNFRECDFAISLCPDVPGRNHRWPLYHAEVGRLLKPRCADELLREKTAFCNFVYHNPECPERNHFYQLLSAYKPVDAPGQVFNNTSGLDARGNPRWRTAKQAYIRKYKFTIAFENVSASGYTSEKIADAMVAGSVPIYWGNPEIADEFNPGAFINCHDFPDLRSVASHVAVVDQDEALYKRYLSASPFKDNVAPGHCDRGRLFAHLDDFFRAPPLPLARLRDPYWAKWYSRLPRQLLNRRRRARKRELRQNEPGLLVEPVVFVISLRRDRGRRQKIVARLGELGVSCRIVDAVDAATMSPREYLPRVSDRMGLLRNLPLSRREIACFMSHYAVWSAIAQEQIAHAVVLEDDAGLADDFYTVVKELMYAGYRWDLVGLSSYRARAERHRGKVLASLGHGRKLVFPLKTVEDTAAYALSGRAAATLVAHTHTIRTPVDTMLRGCRELGLSCLAVWPTPVLQERHDVPGRRMRKAHRSLGGEHGFSSYRHYLVYRAWTVYRRIRLRWWYWSRRPRAL